VLIMHIKHQTRRAAGSLFRLRLRSRQGSHHASLNLSSTISFEYKTNLSLWRKLSIYAT